MINPWSSGQVTDYDRLREDFGIGDVPKGIFDNSLFRRGIIFGQRGLEYIEYCIKNNIQFNAMTGLMPSGEMHLGNKSVMDQILFYQSLGAKITIAVADLESYGTRNLSLEKARDIAINKYLVNYIAMGLKPCRFYFQSESPRVQRLSLILSNEVNLSEMKAIYGFENSSPMLHINAPLVQVGDILHVQSPEMGGPSPTIVPVGADQDPHLRLTRDIANRHRVFNISWERETVKISVSGKYDSKKMLDLANEKLLELNFKIVSRNDNYRLISAMGDIDNSAKLDLDLAIIESKYNENAFIAPSATYQKLLTGLKGGKMSSSKPESLISLNDRPEDAVKKIKSATTGGRATVEEQRIKGGEPDKCPVFELYSFHLSPDDRDLNEIHETCKAGTLLCGACKSEAAERMRKFLSDLNEKRNEAMEKISLYVGDE